MKEAIISKETVVTFTEVDIPVPNDDQLVIKVVVSGTNPKDWKIPALVPNAEVNQGDDIAGIVYSVGKNVNEFKVGDRVAAFHEMVTPGGSFAEYALAWAHTTFHIPESTSFEEAATLPLAAMTSAVGLYSPEQLGLPNVFAPATEPTPLVVYGGASAVGAFAIQFAKKSNIHPIIAVAGNGSGFVEGLIDRSKGDTIIDYRQGAEAVVSGIKEALGELELHYAYDAISEKGSYVNISKAMSSGGRITVVWPADKSLVPDNVAVPRTYVGSVHLHEKDLGFAYFRLIGRGLQEGWFKPHPHQVVPGGLDGVEEALLNLKNGKASAVKYVLKISETASL